MPVTMKRKRNLILAAGWTACTAAAFWAGTHFSSPAAPAGAENTSGRSRISAIQQGRDSIAGRGAGRSSAGPDGASSRLSGREKGGRAISELTPEQTGTRMKEILSIEDPLEKMEAWLEFARGLKGDEQMTAAMEAMTENYSSRERGSEFSALMTRWAKESPEAALAWTQTHNDWRTREGAGTVLAVMARTNPDAAIAWAKAHPPKNKEEGNWHMASVVSGLAKDDPARASTIAQSMDRSDARGRAMDHVLDSFFKLQGPEAAKASVMALEDGPYKNGISARLAWRLAERDPAAAAVWAATLPAGEARPRVITEVVAEWAERNPNEAGNWLNGLGNEPGMDEPRERFAWKVQKKDPEAAIAWANTISDERRRNETAYRLAREWMKREPDNARAWVGSTNLLPANAKERLLNSTGPRG